MIVIASREAQDLTLDLSEKSSSQAKPLLRWAGGKRALVRRLALALPTFCQNSTYYEPFFGAGSLFFEVLPKVSTIGDHNERLMSMYAAIRDQPSDVISKLEEHRLRHGSGHYYEVRTAFNSNSQDTVEQAGRFIYLNSAGYNGVFRVNQLGHYNVPFGRKDARHVPTADRIRAVSKVLQYSTILTGDYESTVKDASKGDFVYLDPPYPPLINTVVFQKYTATGFGPSEHERLACVFQNLTERGVKVLLSIADTPEVRKMYYGNRITEVTATRHVSCKKVKLLVKELAISNY